MQQKGTEKNRIIGKNSVEGRGTDGNRRRRTENVRDEILHDNLVSLRAKLLLEISKLPLKPTVKQQVKVASMRSHLAKQMKDFLRSSTMFLPSLEEGDLK